MDPSAPPGKRGRGEGAGLAASASPALTPHHLRKGAHLNEIIRSLEAEWHLGLHIRDERWSPSKSTGSLAEKVHGLIKRLIYSSPPALDTALRSFEQIASGFEEDERLRVLHGILRSQAPSRTATPASSQASRNVHPKTSRPLHFPISHDSQQPDRSDGLFRNYRDEDPESYYTTALEPGSPTDVDEDENENDEDYVTPPSPTPSFHSAQKRVEASPRLPLEALARKRPSDASDNPQTSPKVTRRSKGKQPLQFAEARSSTSRSFPLFKKPSLEMAPSFQGTEASRSSMTKSFDTVWSSQKTVPNTGNTSLNTSFVSDAGDKGQGEAEDLISHVTRISSTTISSLSDTDLLSVARKLEKELPQLLSSEELTRRSSSTFGSIDEDGLVETSFVVEQGESPERSLVPSVSASPGTPSKGAVDPSSSFSPRRSGVTMQESMAGPSSAFSGPGVCASPTAVLQSYRTPATIDSPSKMPYYIRDIPDQNLFADVLPNHLKRFPYFILFITCRIAIENGIAIEDLLQQVQVEEATSGPESFWYAVGRHSPIVNASVRDPRKVWLAANRGFQGYTFKGRLVFDTQARSSKAFKLQLLPLQPERSCRFQRKFGSDRFLYLEIPPFAAQKMSSETKRFTTAEMNQIERQWKKWFLKEHSFLGRKWRAFHIEPIKKKAGRDKDNKSDKRIVLFATEGIGIDRSMSIGELIHWFFPLNVADNTNQAFCKAYARLDLGLSRTIPTFTFRPSQIRRKPDKYADGTPEDPSFNDERISWHEVCDKPPVMNDGCSLISVGAAVEIWKRYRKAVDTNEPMPSAFQGRIGGAKGLWMVSDDPSTEDAKQREIWIEITDSQLKFEPHVEDQFDEQPFDPLRLTFEYLNHSSSPAPAELHSSFIPILVDRGVPRNAIQDIMVGRLDEERQQLLQILGDPVKLYHWVHQQKSFRGDTENERWQAALPHSLADKIRLLLESGFYPNQELYLAELLTRFIRQRQIWMEQKLRVPIGKATYLYGVADPLGVLKPGEVHVDFSSPFVDESTGTTYRALNNMELLVARQPACRRSDVQKVRAIRHPELTHLVDVVVFPSKGEYPLAGKLQGGDYDGDIFWLCWESTLVKPFKNAPAPLRALDPSKYGIKTDKARLHQIMQDPTNLSNIDLLLVAVLEFRMTPSLLGKVTNFLEMLAYQENRIHSDHLNALCDMHDLLVDALKQGYLFKEEDFQKFIKSLGCGKPKDPAYKIAMKECETAKELGDAEKARKKRYIHKEDNVLDYLYFNVVRNHDVATLESISDVFLKAASDDAVLQRPYLQILKQVDTDVAREMETLADQLTHLSRKWGADLRSQEHLTSEHYNKVVNSSYRSFRALMPTGLTDPEIKRWLHPYLYPEFNLWDTIRASALYTICPTKHVFVWHMAGRELARLKCCSTPGAKFVTRSIFGNLKPKPIQLPKSEEEEEEDEEFERIV